MIELNLSSKVETYKDAHQCSTVCGVLKSPSCLSLCLQYDHLDMVSGIKSVLKSSKSLKSMAEQDPLQWQVPKLFCSRIKDEGGDKIYQGAVLQVQQF